MRLFDLHCDTLSECDRLGCGLWENALDVDVSRLLRFSPGVQVFAAFVPDTLHGEAARDRGRRLLSLAGRLADACPPLVRMRDGAALDRLTEGQCGMWLSAENGAILGGKLSAVAELAAAGVRLLTLTWNGENELGYGCMTGSAEGLKPFGRAVLTELAAYGILPDVSHLNESGFWDVAALTDAPLLATHSLSAAVNPHPRNLTDAQFDCIRDRGGLVGLNLCPAHLGGMQFADFERHLAHFLERGGTHTVAMGCDLDGTALPPGWPGIDTLFSLERRLLRDGFGEDVCDRLFYRNAYAFFRKYCIDKTDDLI